MSPLWERDRDPGKFYRSRSIKTYPAEKIYEEAGFIAYYMHWSHQEIMSFSHLERIRWCNEISAINRKLNDEPENAFKI
ncbi:MAG: DUF6760 family protein [Lachnospiraceae bacterium]